MIETISSLISPEFDVVIFNAVFVIRSISLNIISRINKDKNIRKTIKATLNYKLYLQRNEEVGIFRVFITFKTSSIPKHSKSYKKENYG